MPGTEYINIKSKMSPTVKKCANPHCTRLAGMVGGMIERMAYCSITCAENHRHLLGKAEMGRVKQRGIDRRPAMY
jgi:hypothetical protein